MEALICFTCLFFLIMFLMFIEYETEEVYRDIELKRLKKELKKTRRELAEAKDYISKNFYKLERNKK